MGHKGGPWLTPAASSRLRPPINKQLISCGKVATRTLNGSLMAFPNPTRLNEDSTPHQKYKSYSIFLHASHHASRERCKGQIASGILR